MPIHGLGERFARAGISNTAATAVWLPIGLSIARAGSDRRFSGAQVLAVAYGASEGGIGTPVGTPPNLLGTKALAGAGVEVGFVRWMSVGLPIGLVMLAILVTVFALRFRIGTGALARGAGIAAARP